MNYSEFTNTGSGYKEFAYPESSYLTPPPTQQKEAPKVLGTEGAFLELSPYRDFAKTPAGGVGPFHVNHFAGYFKLNAAGKAKVTIADFFENFGAIFSSSNVAIAARSKYTFDDCRTIQFVFDAPGPNFHEDWITLQKAPGTNSFFARTLARGWADQKDVAGAAILKGLYETVRALESSLPDLRAIDLLLIDLRHFLAGRRSWSIEYSPESDLYYVESVALERYSHFTFLALEGLVDIRNSVDELWTNLIANFATHYGLMLESQDMKKHYPDAKYSRHKDHNIYYIADRKKSAAEARNIPWFSKVLKRHPGLLTP